MRLRPKVLIDIKRSGREDVFLGREKRINLAPGAKKKPRVFYHPLYLTPIAIGLVFVFFLISPFKDSTLAQTADTTAAQRQALENQLSQLEQQIGSYQSTISNYEQQGASLTSAINELNAKINKINLQIKAVTLELQSLDGQIGDTTSKIGVIQTNINANKNLLAGTLEQIYESGNQGFLEILLANPQISDFFTNVNDLINVQGSVKTSVDKMTSLMADLVDQRTQLGLEKSDLTTLQDYQNSQKTAVLSAKQDKSSLLAETKGNESTYQALLQKTQKTAAQIRVQIFQLIGGGQLTFEKAYEYAKFAGQATGVNPALILAILNRESALGQNVGQCGYQTAMSPSNIPIFLNIVNSLGLEKDLAAGVLKVSCPNADGIYGGAMGPAQFIPSTWQIYESEISSITGNNPANPWNDADAFTATALYLKDAGAQTNERVAAAKYYCGSNWNRFVCLNVYGENVVEKTAEFEQDIQILNSNS
ncbi:MAG TPA: lytic murein transglycosylase [Candidatus Tyrphobacter sp.]|nr:lytic murein transglycosylase [Candidatus Tyrphobacter sp.]